MRRRVGDLLFIAVLTATTSAVAQRQPADEPQPSGSARLSGRVVADDDGAPVRRAHVGLSGVPDSQRNAGPNRVYLSRTIETDVNGRFDFKGLPAGWYTINVQAANGFVRLLRPKEVTVGEGRTVELTIRLERAGAIEGRIQDENGDAVLGAEVQAVHRLGVSGYTMLAATGASATTNDLGAFRLFNLPAGEYYVLATHRPWQRRPEPAPRSGYANTYYPGASARRGARAVVVRAGRDSKGVNFALSPCRFVRVTIDPVDSRGVPLGPEAQVSLTRRDDVYLSSSTRHTSRRQDGTFSFDGVQPGDYYLIVTTSVPMQEAAYVNVTIDVEDVSLPVRTNTGARVSGRVIVDGKAAGDVDSRDVWLSANPPLGTYGLSYARVPLTRVRGTDRFELTGLRGPMVLSAEVAGGALLSIRSGGKEIAGRTLEYAGTEAIDDVVIALTTDVARVDVSVTGTSGAADPEPVLVVLFSEDPARWHHGYSRYARTTAVPNMRGSDTKGGALATRAQTTTLTRLPPGRYLIAAIHDADISNPTDARLLERLRRLAVPVTLVAGQTTRVTVGIAKAAR